MAAPSGHYQLIRQGVTTSTAISTNQVLVPAAAAAEFTRVWCNQENTTTTNQTRFQFNRNSTACTVTATSPTSTENGMQASKCVSGVSATGITATAEGTVTATPWTEGFNIVNGCIWLPVPEARFLLVGSAAGFAASKFPSAPASASYTTGVEWLEFAA